MAKVSLRGYNREIEGMIERGQLDESVAHCQHILRTFPMHVETYRLLGKSFLEARRYTDAADVFQRALMAVPDDFVAHVGMSIIRDDEGKLDDAIWHMERAFEDQPSNPAIQGELRRLYGRRDGVEPPKIRLSRDALANMYSKGDLFNQAIAEIRAVLAEDTNRPDLQVMLARAYFRAGQKVEAAEMAANLLKKYTYCLDALRILVEVLPGTARAENTQIYRQRLGMLDPYSSFATASAFGSDQVADGDVNLERLEYKAGAAPASPQTNWASSLGIKLADEKRTEPAPDWMTTGASADKLQAAAPNSSEPPPVPAPDDKPIPEWMRTAGWQDSNGKAEEVPMDVNAAKPVEPLAKADIPDWLKSMAPQEVTDATNSAADPAPPDAPIPGESTAPDWLAELGPSPANANPDPSQSGDSKQDDGNVPDWLKEMGDGASAGTAAAFAADALEQTNTEEPPDALQPIPPPPAVETPVESPDSVPGSDGDDKPSQPTGESKQLNIEDDAMSWLENLAAKQGANEKDLLTNPENRSEDMPDWLRSAKEQTSTPSAQEPVPAPSETADLEPLTPLAPEFVANEPVPSEELPVPTPPADGKDQRLNIGDDTNAWLEGLATEEGGKPGNLVTNASDRSGIPSDWVQKATQGLTSPDEAFTPESVQEDVTITSWLKKQDVIEALGKAQTTPAETPPSDASSNELPDWLKELEKPSSAEETQKPAEDLPDWLRQPAQPSDQVAAAGQVPGPASEPEIHSRGDETIKISKPPAPTTPEEWVPVDAKPAPVSELNPDAEPALKTVETPTQIRVLGGTGMLARIPTQDKDAEFLAAAQAALDANQLNQSMQAYSKLIKKNRLLDEVIHDLREAIYRFPVDIIVWQTLGDASMRSNRLQDALDAYTKAEELLR